MKKLRDYQQVACDYIDSRLKDYRRPFIYVLACGAGKSLVIAEIARRHGGVLVLTLSAELCKQDLEEMQEQGVKASAYSASLNSKEVGNITVATIGSAYKHPEMFHDVEIVVIDEVQSCNPADTNTMFLKLLITINKYRREDGGRVKIVGLTATPYRNVQRHRRQGRWHSTTTLVQPLNRIPSRAGFLWSDIEEGLTTKEAMKRGYLTPIEYYTDPQKTRLEVNSTGAEFTDESLDLWGENAVGRVVEVMEGAEERWNIRSGLVAVPFISHAERVQRACEAKGLSTIVVSSKTPQKARERAIRAFKEGEIKWLIQCNIANVGFNSPITECLVWARPTLSLNLWQQAVGRIIRLSEGKKVARVVDLVGTLKTFGKVEDIHLGKEDRFKTIIEGSRGKKLSGVPLKTFYWVPNIKNKGGDKYHN